METGIGSRIYRGERTKDNVVITVHQGPGSYRALDEGGVDDLPTHADVERFDWGRPSPGSERLAAALLKDALESVADPALVRELTDEIVVGLPYTEPWVLWGQDLREWATGKGATLQS